MGRPKALLDWHGLTAVEHAVEVARDGVGGGPVCVVGAPGQELPALDAIVVDDSVAYGGPLAGLLVGLEALAGQVEVVFASGVDTPLLVPSFIRTVCSAMRDSDDAVVPVIAGKSQPLLASYRVRIAPALRQLLGGGRRGLRDIAGTCAVRNLSEAELLTDAELAAADPGLRSAANANTLEEWAALEG